MAAFNYKQEYERYKKYYLSLSPMLAKPTNRAYTAIILSFLTVSLFGWYALRPTMQTIFTLKRQISDRTDVDKKMEDKISALIEAQAAYENIQEDLPLLTQALPKNSEPIDAVAQLQGLARETNVGLSGLSVPPVPLTHAVVTAAPNAAAKTNDFTVTVSVSGKYEDVKKFILGVTELRRIMQIQSMAFSPKKESSVASGSATPAASSTTVQVELKLKIFYLTS